MGKFPLILVLFVEFLTSFFVEGSELLDYRFVCDKYFECVDEKEQILKICKSDETPQHKYDARCVQKMNEDFKMIESFEQHYLNEKKKCVDDSINGTQKITNLNKNRFCAIYLFDRTSTNGECSARIGKISNRCDALKRCCEPVSRCEQTTMYSETGRTLNGLKEEVGIKMADCAQHELEAHQNKTPEVSKKFRKIKIIESPPFSLCLKYLQCQKDADMMRVNCSKLTNTFSVDGIETSTTDESWQKCRSGLVSDFEKMNERRDEAFAYLDKCVPIANVTREFMISDRVCRASTLKEKKQKPSGNCHLEVAKKRKECALLRDCCVQADVCERSALYAAISDEYLLRRIQLKENLEKCMDRQINLLNSV